MNPDCPYCEFKDGMNIEHPCLEEKAKTIINRIADECESLEEENRLLGKRVETLESALKECVSALEFVSIKMGHTNDSIHVCSVCPKIDSALDRAKKAIGGGNAGD